MPPPAAFPGRGGLSPSREGTRSAAPPMETLPRLRRARLPLLALALVAAPLVAGTLLPLPPPPNVRYSFETGCRVNVTWDPVKNVGDSCIVMYNTCMWIDGGEGEKEESHDQTSRILQVPLGKQVVIGVQTECNEDRGEWLKISLPQEGDPGTGAVNINCIWHKEEAIQCSWQAGEEAPPDTHYHLSYWYEELAKEEQCSNYSREGALSQCSFDFQSVSGLPYFSILVQGYSRSKDIRRMCVLKKDIPRRLDPPSIKNLTKASSGVFLQWTKPIDRNELSYEIEINNTKSGESKLELLKNDVSKSIGLESDVPHTFRVRAKQLRPDDIWSEWSKAEVLGERDGGDVLYYLPYILIPVCVTILSITLLIYLKKIKSLIFPKIPDPRKFLKQMFEEQSEELQKHPVDDSVKDEQTHSLTFVEPTGNED